MGVSLEVWRQRIGCFSMPRSSGSSKRMRSSTTRRRSSKIGIGTKIVVGILIATAIVISSVLIQYHLPARYNTLLTCGDIEQNPGPRPALLSDDVLEKVKSNDSSLQPLDYPLLNKHMQQLYTLRKTSKTTWTSFVNWVKLLQPSFTFDDDDWSKRLCAQSKTLTALRKKIVSSNYRDSQSLETWEDTAYSFPSTVQRMLTFPTPATRTVDTAASDIINQHQILIKENDELKRKVAERPSPHKAHLQSRREIYNKGMSSKLRKTKFKLETKLEKGGAKRQKLVADNHSLRAEIKLTFESAEETNKVLISKVAELTDRCERQAERIKELLEFNASIKDKLEDERKRPGLINTKHVGEKKKSCYTAEMRSCVYKLLSYHVSFENVGPVIKTVLSMIGVEADHLPSDRTVAQFNEERLLISQHQLGKLTQEKNLTLGTDETPKNGDIYMTYTINDDNENTYILGLREMVSKSADDTLTTFKDVLDDISHICNDHITPGNETGIKILSQIKNTMSDRAATESKFNELLKTYRSECLDKCIEGWDSFSVDAQEALKKMNNFFCGLHMLVSMAETIAESFKQFENLAMEGKRVGAANTPGVSVFGSDSGTVRLVRTTCKALAKGADEKSGAYRQWNTYLRNAGVSKRYLQTFHGNRFNIVFLLGGCVFHLRSHIWNFLNCTIGQTNGLLKAVHADVQQNTFMAGCKVLGILNKMITAPLWRITEQKGHILQMCDIYLKMDTYFDECLKSDNRIEELIRGESSCFDQTLITNDEVFDSLVQPWENDNIVKSMMVHTLGALKQLIGRVNKDYLPDGKFYIAKDNETFLKQTTSVPRHNKLPETVFGYLDFLIKKRPNSTAIANEAQVMFVFNKTGKFMDALTPEQREKLINKVLGKGTAELRRSMKEREKARHEILLKKQLEKKQKIQTAAENTLRRKEELTVIIVDAGLWQTRQKVNTVMDSIPNTNAGNNERHTALKNQIKFRRQILHQHIDGDKKFFFSDNGKPKPWQQIRDHLFKFIDAAQSVTEGQSVQTTVAHEESVAIPLLVGKTVKHYMHNEIEYGGIELVPYTGKVISQVPGFPEWFNIVYKDDDAVYSYRLVDDYRQNNLEIIPGH